MPSEQGGDAMDVDAQRSTLFTQHHVFPASKMVTFNRCVPFLIAL
jgi:hypothetical protein